MTIYGGQSWPGLSGWRNKFSLEKPLKDVGLMFKAIDLSQPDHYLI